MYFEFIISFWSSLINVNTWHLFNGSPREFMSFNNLIINYAILQAHYIIL
jgi:hypothetical protein